MSRILITGASGCVGQYVTRWLLDNSDAELLLWLRDPAKLTAVPADHPRIRLLIGDRRIRIAQLAEGFGKPGEHLLAAAKHEYQLATPQDANHLARLDRP